MTETNTGKISSVQSCPALCDPKDYSTLGFPVHHQLLELAQTLVCWVSDAIQPSNPLLSSSPPPFSFSQHQGLFNWVSSSHQVAEVLELQLRHPKLIQKFFQSMLRVDFLQDWLVWSPYSPRDSQESSPTPHFKSINSSMLSLLYDPTLTSTHNYWKNYSFD